jgi:hypothetical protein
LSTRFGRHRITTDGTSFKIRHSSDKATDKVPLRDGQFSTGFSQNGVTVSISGALGKRDNAIHFTQEEMWLLYKELLSRTMLNHNDPQFEFFVMYKPSTAIYQKYKKGSGENLEIEIGDDDWNLFKYDLTMFFDDPVIYDTAPGA